IRDVLKLKSANFTVKFKDSSFTFTTSGYGHGVGMSQYGADYMARQGSDYKEILLHYYSGVSLDSIKQ
ncbi:MAG: stage II sporulation protein D, partial [Oscillospiraceae bacterium]